MALQWAYQPYRGGTQWGRFLVRVVEGLENIFDSETFK